jgi:hypothetical protein
MLWEKPLEESPQELFWTHRKTKKQNTTNQKGQTNDLATSVASCVSSDTSQERKNHLKSTTNNITPGSNDRK